MLLSGARLPNPSSPALWSDHPSYIYIYIIGVYIYIGQEEIMVVPHKKKRCSDKAASYGYAGSFHGALRCCEKSWSHGRCLHQQCGLEAGIFPLSAVHEASSHECKTLDLHVAELAHACLCCHGARMLLCCTFSPQAKQLMAALRILSCTGRRDKGTACQWIR